MSTRPPRTFARSLPALAALTLAGILALAGCVTIDADLTITGDTASGTVITALDQEAQELGVNPDEVFLGIDEGLTGLAGVTAAPYESGSVTGTEYTFDQVRLEDLNRLSEQDPDGMRITRDERAGTYEVAMVMDLAWMADLEEDSLQAQPGDPAAPDPAELLERFDATIAVTFPGDVTEHNGELSGTTVTWRPPPGERTELHAVALAPDAPPGAAPTEPGQPETAEPGQPEQAGPDAPRDAADGGAPSPALILLAALGGVVLLAVAGLTTLWLVRRRRPDAAALSETLAGFEKPEPEPAQEPEPATAGEPTAEQPLVTEPEPEPEPPSPPPPSPPHQPS